MEKPTGFDSPQFKELLEFHRKKVNETYGELKEEIRALGQKYDKGVSLVLDGKKVSKGMAPHLNNLATRGSRD